MSTPTRAETTSHAPDCPCAWCRVDRANATMMMCADLARAMGWTAKSHFPDSFQPHFWIAPSGRTFEVAPDPFTSAEANRKLVEWLATQSGEVQRVFVLTLRDEVIERDICYELALLTAPLETIAEAAWRAIQMDVLDRGARIGEADDKGSQNAHEQPCPCAWCRVDRDNAEAMSQQVAKSVTVEIECGETTCAAVDSWIQRDAECIRLAKNSKSTAAPSASQ